MTRTVVIDRDKFFKMIDHNKQEVVDYILSGRCVNFEDYKKRTGILLGIAVASDCFKDTVKSEEDDDE